MPSRRSGARAAAARARDPARAVDFAFAGGAPRCTAIDLEIRRCSTSR
jgi:hypothetical protein